MKLAVMAEDKVLIDPKGLDEGDAGIGPEVDFGRCPELIIDLRALKNEAGSLLDSGEKPPEGNGVQRVGFHANPGVIGLVDPEHAFHVAEEEGVGSGVGMDGLRANLPGGAAIDNRFAHHGEVEGLRDVLKFFALFIAVALLVSELPLLLGGAQASGFLGGPFVLLLLLVGFGRRQRFAVFLNQEAKPLRTQRHHLHLRAFDRLLLAGGVQFANFGEQVVSIVAPQFIVALIDSQRALHDGYRVGSLAEHQCSGGRKAE